MNRKLNRSMNFKGNPEISLGQQASIALGARSWQELMEEMTDLAKKNAAMGAMLYNIRQDAVKAFNCLQHIAAITEKNEDFYNVVSGSLQRIIGCCIPQSDIVI